MISKFGIKMGSESQAKITATEEIMPKKGKAEGDGWREKNN
jgi:hypothetical protein